MHGLLIHCCLLCLICLYFYLPKEFFDIVGQQKKRLFDGDWVELEDQFRLFKHHINDFSASWAEVKQYESCLDTEVDVFGKT